MKNIIFETTSKIRRVRKLLYGKRKVKKKGGVKRLKRT